MKNEILKLDQTDNYNYPRLMQRKCEPLVVVLFSSYNKGVVVFSYDEGLCVGEHRDNFVNSLFEPFNDKIVLSN